MVYKHAEMIQTHKHVPDVAQHIYRQVPIARYVNWMLTSPLLLVNMALLSGLPGARLLPAIAADLLMFVTGLLGTFADRPASRWVWFSLSCVAYLAMVYQIGMHGQRSAGNKDPQTRRFFGSLVAVTLLVKALYPMYVPASPACYTMIDANASQHSGGRPACAENERRLGDRPLCYPGYLRARSAGILDYYRP